MELGQKLKEARIEAALSQNALAEKIGVSRQTVSNWEHNRSYPDIGSLLKLSELYGLSLDELLKGDQTIQAHFEQLAGKRKRMCQILLEIGILLELFGTLMLGQDFETAGFMMNMAGTFSVYIAIMGHLRYFNHTQQEVRYGIAGLVIQMVCMAVVLLCPEQSGDWLFRLVRLAGIFLIWCSGVWGMFWKSPRVWVYVALIAAVPLFTWMTQLQSMGAFQEENPFLHDYGVAQVLYSEEDGSGEGVKVHLSSTAGVICRMSFSKYCDDYQQMGSFTYIEPIPGQSAKGIWQLIPEDAPDAMYQVTVEADDSVTLSYSEGDRLQYKWLLCKVDTASGRIATAEKTVYVKPTWYPAGSDDPEPLLKEVSVVGTATMNLRVGGLETEQLTLIEEYHHGDSVEYQTHTLALNENGDFSLELATRYDGVQEYALYRIPFASGEYRFTLTFSF